MSAEVKQMAKIWTIESGEYSDYRVNGIYSTKENAEAVLAKLASVTGFGFTEYRLRERDLDPGVEALREGYTIFVVNMLYDGTVEKISPSEWELSEETWIWRRTTAPFYRGKGIPDVLVVTTFARGEAHAVKIANEKRVQKIAGNEW